MSVVLTGCAQVYGRYARRGTHIVVKAAEPNALIQYQILVPPGADDRIEFLGFNLDQPILKTDEQSFMFSIGHFVIRHRCGARYVDTPVQFRKVDPPQVVPLSCAKA
jgi:hypothetical protein